MHSDLYELILVAAVFAVAGIVKGVIGLGLNNGLGGAVAIPAAIALAASFVGMAIGKALRSRLSVAAFRRFVLLGLLALGITMIVRGVV